MSAVIAAAYFAVQRAAGRRARRRWSTKLSAHARARTASNYLNILPDFTNNWDLAVAVFIMPIAVQWWAVWYPGAEPGGGSYIAQRMLASKSEKDALGARAVLQRRALRAAARGRGSSSRSLAHRLSRSCRTSRRRSPTSIRRLLGHDIAYPAMLKFLPGGLHRADGRRADRGELVDDPDAPELGRVLPRARLLPPLHPARTPTSSTTCCAGRVATVGLFVCSSATVYLLDTAQGRVRHHPAGRRGHRAALSGALVLVAGQRLVRDRRDGQFVRRLRRAARARARAASPSARTWRC